MFLFARLSKEMIKGSLYSQPTKRVTEEILIIRWNSILINFPLVLVPQNFPYRDTTHIELSRAQ